MEKLQLDYFLSVAETLNISKSAEMLCISQPSLSQTIKKLEGEIGYPLFDRNGKHISLNKNGHIFLECVRQMKRLYENALEEIDETNNRYNRQISINMRCASQFLPQLLTYLGEKLQGTTFQISQQNHAASPNEEADIKITATSEPLEIECASLLLEENIMLAVPKNHRLFRRKKISTVDLQEESFISLNPSWSLEQMIQMACEKKSFVPNVLIRLDNPDLLRRLLVEKLGLAFVPEKTWGKAFSNGEFDLCPVSDLPIKRYVYVVWNEGFVRENVRQCISCIEDFFNRMHKICIFQRV